MLLLSIGTLGMVIAGVAMAVTWSGIPTWARWLVGGGCGVGLIAVAIVAVRKLLGHPPGGQVGPVLEDEALRDDLPTLVDLDDAR